MQVAPSSVNLSGLEPSAQEIKEKPWKYIGYKGYSKFIASETDYYVLRSFSSLNTRVALSLQNELVLLEEELNNLDKIFSRRDADDNHNGSFRNDQENRRDLIRRIHAKLVEYS